MSPKLWNTFRSAVPMSASSCIYTSRLLFATFHKYLLETRKVFIGRNSSNYCFIHMLNTISDIIIILWPIISPHRPYSFRYSLFHEATPYYGLVTISSSGRDAWSSRDYIIDDRVTKTRRNRPRAASHWRVDARSVTLTTSRRTDRVVGHSPSPSDVAVCSHVIVSRLACSWCHPSRTRRRSVPRGFNMALVPTASSSTLDVLLTSPATNVIETSFRQGGWPGGTVSNLVLDFLARIMNAYIYIYTYNTKWRYRDVVWFMPESRYLQ